jgi:hypothetical protein
MYSPNGIRPFFYVFRLGRLVQNLTHSIEKAHAFGHFGRDAVMMALRDEGKEWSGMANDVQAVLSECVRVFHASGAE